MSTPSQEPIDSEFIEDEFYKLLSESGFVARVIEIQRTPDDCDSPTWQNIVEQNLPHWLFCVTEILTTQAKLAGQDRPMSGAQLAELLKDRLIRQVMDGLRLKPARKRIWTMRVLRLAVNEALKDINTPGAVTLDNLAQRITWRARKLSQMDLKKPLSGKHLQKLLRQHDIDWIKIKRSYKDRLLTEFMKRPKPW